MFRSFAEDRGRASFREEFEQKWRRQGRLCRFARDPELDKVLQTNQVGSHVQEVGCRIDSRACSDRSFDQASWEHAGSCARILFNPRRFLSLLPSHARLRVDPGPPEAGFFPMRKPGDVCLSGSDVAILEACAGENPHPSAECRKSSHQ